jgi:hypothetical protein
MITFEIANILAADLAGASMDPNEAQKALAYLRKTQDGRLFFDYLRAIKKDGRAVIRSGQTLRYYDDLLSACERHLRPLQNKPEEMLYTLAWAIRLLRYYRAVPEAAEMLADEQRSQDAKRTSPPLPTQASAPIPRPAAPQIPAIGEVFGGRVRSVEPAGVQIQVKSLSEDLVIGVIKAEALAGRQYRVGDTARVEVVGTRTLKSGLIVLEVKPAPKPPKS